MLSISRKITLVNLFFLSLWLRDIETSYFLFFDKGEIFSGYEQFGKIHSKICYLQGDFQGLCNFSATETLRQSVEVEGS